MNIYNMGEKLSLDKNVAENLLVNILKRKIEFADNCVLVAGFKLDTEKTVYEDKNGVRTRLTILLDEPKNRFEALFNSERKHLNIISSRSFSKDDSEEEIKKILAKEIISGESFKTLGNLLKSVLSNSLKLGNLYSPDREWSSL